MVRHSQCLILWRCHTAVGFPKKKKKRLRKWKHLVVNTVYLHFQSSVLKVRSFACRQTKNSFQLLCTAKLSFPTAAWIRESLKSFELCRKSEESLPKVLHDFNRVPPSFTLCFILSLRSALPLWFVQNLDRCAVDEVQVWRGWFEKRGVIVGWHANRAAECCRDRYTWWESRQIVLF